MNSAYALRYFVGFIPSAFVLLGNLLGGYWTVTNIVWTTGVMVVADWFAASKRNDPPTYSSATLPDFVLYGSVVLHTLSVASLLYAAFVAKMTFGFLVLASLSTGINAGISGIVIAHELIHRKKASERFWGQWNLVLVNYMHFYVEHIRGHHRTVGTPEDPATARYGESLYAFWLRTIPGQWRSALRLEVHRLTQMKAPVYGFQNYVVRAACLQVMLCVAIGVLLGAWALYAYLIQSFFAILLLEYVNYIEHYGLVRESGKKVEVHHSWQSDKTTSRFTLVELSRHSDHHLKASKPYHTLVSHEASPELPSGYFGMFYAALIPPIWFKLVHARIAKQS